MFRCLFVFAVSLPHNPCRYMDLEADQFTSPLCWSLSDKFYLFQWWKRHAATLEDQRTRRYHNTCYEMTQVKKITWVGLICFVLCLGQRSFSTQAMGFRVIKCSMTSQETDLQLQVLFASLKPCPWLKLNSLMISSMTVLVSCFCFSVRLFHCQTFKEFLCKYLTTLNPMVFCCCQVSGWHSLNPAAAEHLEPIGSSATPWRQCVWNKSHAPTTP